MNVRMGAIGEPQREVVVTPEREPVPQPVRVPDSPAGLPQEVPSR
ncbi:MAG TPA: hypothetical protein VF244_11040 [Acidimicrobiales bacterium]